MSSRTSLRVAQSPRWWYAVAALTLIALLVRIPGLNGGLWIDEIVSIIESFRTSLPQSLAEYRGDNKHPLYAVFAHASIVAFGEHPWSVRLPATLFGVASVPLLYALGTRIATRSEALAAAALLALSYHHVWFSQNARGYTMLAFWMLLGTMVLLRAMRVQSSLPWIGYGVISALGVYTHLTFVFPVLGQAAVVLLGVLGIPRSDSKLRWKGPLAGYSAALMTALLLYAPMLEQVVYFFRHRQSELRGLSTPGWAFVEGVRVLRSGFGALGGVGAVVLLAGGAIAVVGLASYWRRQPRVCLVLVMPGLMTLGGAIAAGRTIYPRFFFAFIGFALLFWMRGAFLTAEWIARRLRWSDAAGQRIGAAMAGMTIAASALSLPRVWSVPKQDFGAAMRFVESSVSRGDVIATANVTSLVYGPFYRREWRIVRNGAELDSLRASATVWLVYAFPRYLARYDPAIGATVERECRSASRFHGNVGDGDVIVCRLASR